MWSPWYNRRGVRGGARTSDSIDRWLSLIDSRSILALAIRLLQQPINLLRVIATSVAFQGAASRIVPRNTNGLHYRCMHKLYLDGPFAISHVKPRSRNLHHDKSCAFFLAVFILSFSRCNLRTNLFELAFLPPLPLTS